MALLGKNILIFGQLTAIIVGEVNVALCNQHIVRTAQRSWKNRRILPTADRKCRNSMKSAEERKKNKRWNTREWWNVVRELRQTLTHTQIHIENHFQPKQVNLSISIDKPVTIKILVQSMACKPENWFAYMCVCLWFIGVKKKCALFGKQAHKMSESISGKRKIKQTNIFDRMTFMRFQSRNRIKRHGLSVSVGKVVYICVCASCVPVSVCLCVRTSAKRFVCSMSVQSLSQISR